LERVKELNWKDIDLQKGIFARLQVWNAKWGTAQARAVPLKMRSFIARRMAMISAPGSAASF
jgi:hypothetical protein